MQSKPESPQLDELLAHASWVRALARNLVSDRELAEDLVQETWAAALKNPPSAGSQPRAWLGQVLRNLAAGTWRSEIRRSKTKEQLRERRHQPNPEEFLERAAIQRELVDSVWELDSRYRDVLLLRFFEELPPREIARQLDANVHTVQTRIRRALAQLRSRLQSRYGDSWHSRCMMLLTPSGLTLGTSSSILSGTLAMSVLSKCLIAGSVVIAGWLYWDHSGHPANRPPESKDSAEEDWHSAEAIENREPAAVEARKLRQSVASKSPIPPPGWTHLRWQVRLAENSQPTACTFTPHFKLEFEEHTIYQEIYAQNGWNGVVGNFEPISIPASGTRTLLIPVGHPTQWDFQSLNSLKIGPQEGVKVPAFQSDSLQEQIVTLPSSVDLVFYGRLIPAVPQSDSQENLTIHLHRNYQTETPLALPADGLIKIETRSWTEPYLFFSGPQTAPFFTTLERGHEIPARAKPLHIQKGGELQIVLTELGGRFSTDLVLRVTAAKRSMFVDSNRSIPDLGKLEWSGKPDSNQTYSFQGLPVYTGLVVSAWNKNERVYLHPEVVSLQPDEKQQLHWNLSKGARVHGRVFDSEFTPLPEIDVWLIPKELYGVSTYQEGHKPVRTQDGFFQFEAVPSGFYVLHIDADSLPPEVKLSSDYVQTLVVDSEIESVEVQVVLQPTARLAGQVLDTRGQGIGRVTLTAWTDSGPVTTLSEENGAFIFKDLPIAETYLNASPSQSKFLSSESLVVTPGGPPVTFILEDAGSLTLKVRTRDDKLPTRIRMVLSKRGVRSGRPYREYLMRLDASGDLRLEQLHFGSYDLYISSNNGLCALQHAVEVQAVPDSPTIEILLRHGGKLKLHYVGQQPCEVQLLQDGCRIGWIHWQEPANGEWVVPAGPLQVHWQPSTSTPNAALFPAQQRNVFVVSGQTQSLGLSTPAD